MTMLMPSIFYTDQITQAIKQKLLTNPDWFLYLNMMPSSTYIPNIPDNEWEHISRVSIETDPAHDDILHGMMTANVCRTTNTIDNISSWSTDSALFVFDLLEFLKQLTHQFDCIRFSAVKDAPTDKMWTCALTSAKADWRVVGTFTKFVRLQNGQVVDVKWFEVYNV